jgi:hypothetical protein
MRTEVAALPTIMVGCPVSTNHLGGDRNLIFKDYLMRLTGLIYPTKKLSLCFLFNDCQDDSYEVFLKWVKDREQDYRRVGAIVRNYGATNYTRNKETTDFSHLAQVRNDWLDLKEDEDYLLSVDSDIMVDAWLVHSLLDDALISQSQITSALVSNSFGTLAHTNCMKKARVYTLEAEGPVGFNIPADYTYVHWNFSKPPEEPIIYPEVTGAAYLIKKEVLAAGVNYGYHKQGEDVYFCERALEAGFTIACDTSLRLLHLMSAEMHDQYKRGEI